MEPSALDAMVTALGTVKTDVLAAASTVIAAGAAMYAVKFGAGWVKGLFGRIAR